MKYLAIQHRHVKVKHATSDLTLNVMFRVAPIFMNISPETSSPFISCFISNSLQCARLDLSQMLLQLVFIYPLVGNSDMVPSVL